MRLRSPTHPKEGSALIIVLAVAVILALLVANFGADMNAELKAAGSSYEEAVNTQLCRSALALARLEIGQDNTRLYANGYGDAYLVSGTEDYETVIEELQEYRSGYALGRGMLAYQLVYKPSAIDPNELGQESWHRLFEVACDMDEGTDRSELVDAILDWIDADSNTRANGMEEEDYQALDNPRHVKNGRLESPEELMLVYGITPDLFYGRGHPAHIEDDMVWGGGLQRYLIGDNSPEGEASAQYILQGTYPDDVDTDEDEELEYEQVNTMPDTLYLIAQGFAPDAQDEEEKSIFGEVPEEITFRSRRFLLVELKLGEGNGASYELEDMVENASGEMIERILTYGVPEEEEI
ncbi:general secretion pathway protein GspK [Pontiella agarivorans]|uniref:Type II secretion system protein GspK n=1 Tax=Pontiella agarivorans TaxID=3038953 RepID=A0ABU5MWX0_9BACT|nr:type II secretion system protein GspK [Pontiella agarivorans]MDZ8118561.1 type II secretion system protein GspK [Pontiella agarivorans]